MDHVEEMVEVSRFIDLAVTRIAGLTDKRAVRILDFGCGAGTMMNALAEKGYETYGCDVVLYKEVKDLDRARKIENQPYRIPYDDNFFDIVTSTSVLEHARNPDEYMPEIARVLKPGGHAMHILPGKWYLPSEPHIFVPLCNFFWPRCPTWWFALWALLGWRGWHQKGMDWRETVKTNRAFYDNYLIYLTTRQFNDLSKRYFGEYQWPMDFFIEHADGGLARLTRRLPLRGLWGWISREFRMGFLVQRKVAA